MPCLRIDNRAVDVPEGASVLDAARKLGLDIPALCFREGHEPATSCMVCLVRVKGVNRLVPSCATPARDGMEVESETEEIRRIRRTGLELLLSDHVGDCVAPCEHTCPAHMDIPLMLRQVAAGRLKEAIATIKKDIALPAVLGRVCPEVCEQACRRGAVDAPAAICLIKRFVADADLASQSPYLPPRKPDTGKTVAIVGSGPTGLAAAYHLLQEGHACTLFDERAEAGGLLRRLIDEGKLPRDVLDAEIAVIERLGANFELGVQIGWDLSLEEVRARFDAVLIATGIPEEPEDECLGIPVREGRIQTDSRTHETSVPGVFAAGDAVRPNRLVVRSVADGKTAAISIDQHLRGVAVTGSPAAFNIPAGRLTDEELAQLASGASRSHRVTTAEGLTEQQAREEALRCLNCDCGKQKDCRLRRYAEAYGAKPSRYRGDRRSFERHLQHGEVAYEPGKCILCGLCVQIASEAREPLGLTFIGRGFNVRVDVPFDGTIAEALRHTARRCAEACPTGAIVLISQRQNLICEPPGAPPFPKERAGDAHTPNTGIEGV